MEHRIKANEVFVWKEKKKERGKERKKERDRENREQRFSWKQHLSRVFTHTHTHTDTHRHTNKSSAGYPMHYDKPENLAHSVKKKGLTNIKAGDNNEKFQTCISVRGPQRL